MKFFFIICLLSQTAFGAVCEMKDRKELAIRIATAVAGPMFTAYDAVLLSDDVEEGLVTEEFTFFVEALWMGGRIESPRAYHVVIKQDCEFSSITRVAF